MLGSGLNLVTTVVGFGMSATFIVFVCTRLLCGRIRSTDSRATPVDIELRSEIDQSERTISGLEPVLVASIPTVKYKREDFSAREDAQCSICLGEYEEKEILRVMPSCHHNFHLVCIDVWLQKQSTCPICRLPLNESLEAKYAASLLYEEQPGRRNQDISDYQYNQWLLPRGQRSERAGNSHEIHEPEAITIEVPYGEDRSSRA